MNRILRTSLLALFLTTGVAALPPASPAHAEAPAAATATSFLRAKHESIVALLKSNAADKDKKVDAELDAMVDYDQMAQDALGANWAARKESEQKEFKDLLHQLIQKNYKKRLMSTLDYRIDYTGEDAKGTDAVVHTSAQNINDKREAPVQIDYVVRKRPSGFVVVDLVPETSSVIKTYNKEFTKLIKDKGWDEVIKKMKDKLAKA